MDSKYSPQIKFDEILFIKQHKDQVIFHTINGPVNAIYSLENLEKELPSSKFLRIHEEYIVAVDAIQSISKTELKLEEMIIPIQEQYFKNLITKLNPQ
jgi:DNA-binding LytR/AlgR family response regulator